MRKRSKSDWYIHIDSWIMDLPITGNEILVYAVINGFTNEEGSCWKGTLKTLSQRTKCSVASLKRILKTLEDKHLIAKVPGSKDSLPEYRVIFEDEACQEELIEVSTKVDSEPVPEKSAPEKKERKDCYKIYRDAYLEKRKELEYCLDNDTYNNSREPAIYGAVINARLKEWIQFKGVNLEEFKSTLNEIAKSNFCVKQLNFDFQRILSEKIFGPCLYDVRKNKTSKPVFTNIVEIPPKRMTCPICGCDNVNIFGTCMVCNPDKFVDEMGKNL